MEGHGDMQSQYFGMVRERFRDDGTSIGRSRSVEGGDGGRQAGIREKMGKKGESKVWGKVKGLLKTLDGKGDKTGKRDTI